MSDAPCGTLGGYSRHYRRKDDICPPCRDEYNRRRRERRAEQMISQDVIADLVAGHRIRTANQAERRAAARRLTLAGWQPDQVAGQLQISLTTVRRVRAKMRAESPVRVLLGQL